MKYLLDANVYIQSYNLYYPKNIFSSYWKWIDEQAIRDNIGSIDLIREELKDGNDELAKWAKERKDHFISCTEIDTQTVYSEIANWVMQGNYNEENRDNFLAKGDPWLIAKAKIDGAIVVTKETLVGQDSKKVKIPNICRQFNVECISDIEMLKRLNPKF